MSMNKDEGGSEEQGQTGFADDLAQAWDEVEAKGTEPEASDNDIHDKDIVDGLNRPRDEFGRFAAKSEQVGDEREGDDAPYHWSQADKDAFNSLPAELRPLYLEKAKSLESGWNRKFEEIAGIRKLYEEFTSSLPEEQRSPDRLMQVFGDGAAVQQMLAPYQPQLAESGLTPIEYIARLVNVARSLQ
jgi:hypothetical protein